MKKRRGILNKILSAAAVIALTFNTGTVAAFAAAKTEAAPEVLTVQNSVNYAVTNSNSLKKAEEDNYIARENHETLLWSFHSAVTEEEHIKAAIALTRNEVQTALAYPEIANQKKSLELTITRYFETILSAERSLELYDEKLELDKKDLEITKVKAELGMVSKSALDSAQLAYDKAVINRDSKVKAIDDAYRTLRQTMGVSETKKYKVALKFTYKPFTEGNLDGYINDAYVTNLQIMTLTENYNLAKYEHDMTSFASLFEEESSVLKLNQQLRSIEEAKTKLRDTIKTYYEDILSAEQNYDLALVDIAAMEKQLEIKKTQLELGKITQIEVDKYEYEILNAQNSLEDIIANHEMTVLQFVNTELL
ncbi:MAG: TolC family protein [Clostridiales bacterium]|jgi:outer membrane protein TolC|nr:TolC family protein [Clostridiales bacterium]